jgi:glycosyltransferase involved in cell wall biosynthesis
MSIPRVSVCIDVYNYADFLPAAIESALEQTLTDMEVIVLDDCSTDASFAVAQEYAARDNRVRAVRNSANLGMVRNRNACLALARSEYVKFIHADDFLCSPTALERMVERMESNPAAVLVACATRFVREDAAPTGHSHAGFPDPRFLAGTTVIGQCLRAQKNLIGGPSAVLFRRSKALRGFDERYFHAADLEMWFHLLEQGCFGYIRDALVAYRWHPRQQTEKDRLTLSQANDQRALLATYLDKPYNRLRPWLKEYLLHDSVRQTARRSAKIGQSQFANDVISAYGKQRYFINSPWCFAWKRVGKKLSALQERDLPLRARSVEADLPPRYPQGFNVAGFLKGQYGIGESSRAFHKAVAATGLPVVAINIDSREHRNQENALETFARHNPYGINLSTFSFDYARRFYRDRGPRFFEGRHNIALWYWELERFPARRHDAFDYYDEIWVPTRFCGEAFRAVSPIPVYWIPYPLEPYEGVSARADFALPEDACVFLCSFDFYSTLARKNPLGTIAAFRKAFAPEDKATLVLKSINSRQDPSGREQIRKAIEGLNVVWIEEHLSGTQMRALFASVDCYVSLHRSEGLGLGMAQAMSAGKPVIATAYSGNREFMNAENSLLVDYALIELTEDYGPVSNPRAYERGNYWAEPDTEHAADQMRHVYLHPEARKTLGERARQDIRDTLNPARTRAEILARVAQIYHSKQDR